VEPKLVTDPRLAQVLAELVKREPIFHRPELGTSRRDFALDTLEARHRESHDDPWRTRDFHCTEIAPDNYLLTYTLEQGPRVTRRLTLWRRRGGDWRIVYHQGTIVEGESR